MTITHSGLKHKLLTCSNMRSHTTMLAFTQVTISCSGPRTLLVAIGW